jgi:hypothetical protein
MTTNYKTYGEFRKAERDAINALPIEFAFSKEQFEQGMKNLGLTVDDKDKVCAMPFCGGFIRKTDTKTVIDTFIFYSRELDRLMLDDDFAVDAIRYELDNHEYGYTGDPSDALEALGLPRSISELDDRMKSLFSKATKLCYYE